MIVLAAGNGSGRVTSSDAAVEIDCAIANGAPSGTGCSAEFEDAGQGGTFSLVATPDAGSSFSSWAGCTSTTGTSCTLTFPAEPDDQLIGGTVTFTADASSCSNSVTIQDAFTSDAGWARTVLVNSGAPTETAAWLPTGGSSGGYRRMEHIFPAAGEIYVYHDYTTTTYNPGTQGAIDHINYYEDQIEFNPPSPGDQIGTGFTMTQGTSRSNVIMRPPGGFFTNTAWESTSRLDLTAADFPAMNFTATGGPITFGYFRSNTVIGGGATLTHGIDNWRVDICR